MTKYLGLAESIDQGKFHIRMTPRLFDQSKASSSEYAEWCFVKPILFEILQERFKQDLKWGADADYSHSLDRMNTILVEEVGEVSRAINDGDIANLRVELLQVAAVAMKIVEKLDLEDAFAPSSIDELVAYDAMADLNALYARGLVTFDAFTAGASPQGESIPAPDRGYSLGDYYAKSERKVYFGVDGSVVDETPEDERMYRSDNKHGRGSMFHESDDKPCPTCFPNGVYIPFGMVREECAPGTFYVGPLRDLMVANESAEQFTADIASVIESTEFASNPCELLNAILYSADTLRAKTV